MGIGAGWNEREHAALGIPYPDTVERVDRMEEQLAIIKGCGTSPTAGPTKASTSRSRTPSSDRAARGRNIIVGGVGRPRSCRLGAQYADEYNISSSNPAEVREINAKLDAACEKLGRDPGTLTRSVMAGVLVGRDEADLADRARLARWPSSAARSTVRRRGSMSARTAGSWARRIRPGHASRRTRRPASTAAVPGLPAPRPRPHRHHGRAVRLTRPRQHSARGEGTSPGGLSGGDGQASGEHRLTAAWAPG